MAKLPSMSLYVDDFEAHTAHLSFAEDGAYNRLLRLCWRQSSCSLPDDDAWIRRHLRATSEEYERLIVPIIEEFFLRSGGRVFQKRQQREFEKAKNLTSARKTAGQKGGRAKAQKTNGNPSSKATDLPEQKSGKAEASTSTSITTSKESTGLGLEPRSLSPGDSGPDPGKPDPKKFQMTMDWSMPAELQERLEARFMAELGWEGFWRQVGRFVEKHVELGTVDTAQRFGTSLENWLARHDANRDQPCKINGNAPEKSAKTNGHVAAANGHDKPRTRGRGGMGSFSERILEMCRQEKRKIINSNQLMGDEEIQLKIQIGKIYNGEDVVLGVKWGPNWTAQDVFARLPEFDSLPDDQSNNQRQAR